MIRFICSNCRIVLPCRL